MYHVYKGMLDKFSQMRGIKFFVVGLKDWLDILYQMGPAHSMSVPSMTKKRE